MIIIISCILYLFIGGLLNGLSNEQDDEINIPAILFWPIILVLWIGDEVGQFLRKEFKKLK